MSRVKRIEVLDGAASSLYGSDAIAGVINIITDQPTQDMLSVTSDTRVSGHGALTESVGLDIYKNGFGSYTSFSHDRADSYQNSNLEYKKGSDPEADEAIAKNSAVNGFLKQGLDERPKYDETIEKLKAAVS